MDKKQIKCHMKLCASRERLFAFFFFNNTAFHLLVNKDNKNPEALKRSIPEATPSSSLHLSLKRFLSKPQVESCWTPEELTSLYRQSALQKHQHTRKHPLCLALSSPTGLTQLYTLICRNVCLSGAWHSGVVHRGEAVPLPPSPGTASGAGLSALAGPRGWLQGRTHQRRKAWKYRETETTVLSFSPHTRTWTFSFWAK